MIAGLLVAASAGVSLGAVIVAGTPSVLRSRWASLGAPAVVSAVAATFAPGQATGWFPLDLVARAALGAGIVFLGARCRPRAALLGAVGATVAATGASVQPLGAAAGGLLLAAVLSSGHHPFVTAVASGMVGQVALRLSRPHVATVTAVVAVVILAPIVVSGVSDMDARARRRIFRCGLLLGGLAVVGAGLGLVSALLARPSLTRGVSVVSGEVIDQGSGGQPASARLLVARRDFRTARRTLGSWWARPAAAVPVVAQHWRALRGAALTGEQLSELGLRVATSFPASGVQVSDGQVPLDALISLQPALTEAARDLGAARRRLAAVHSVWLLPPLRVRLDDGRERVAGAESGTRTALRVLPQLPALLGGHRPRRYFLAIQTPAELRASGGFLGNYGEISADNGRLRLTRFGSILDLYGGDLQSRRLVAPPDYTRRYSRFLPQQEWANVNLSPDFPTDAQVIAGLYPQSGGEPVDGVVAVDPTGLAALLRVVGPVQVAGWPSAITADNVSAILVRDQYTRFEHREAERAEFVNDLAQGVWHRLTTGSFPLSRMLGSLGPVISGKHLQLASTTAGEERLFESLGAAGQMAPVDGDFLAVVTQNAGANKLDAYLRRQVDYRVELDPGNGRLQARVRVTLHNDAPPAGLPSYVVGQTTPPVPTGDNKIYLSIYSPWRLSQAQIDGRAASLESGRELGRQVYSAFVVVPAKGSLVVDLDLSGHAPQGGDYRLTVHRQATANADDVRTSLALPFGWSVGGPPATQTSDRFELDADRTVRVPVRRQW